MHLQEFIDVQVHDKIHILRQLRHQAPLQLEPFFLITSVLMAVLVVVFAGGGTHALIEGDLIEGHYLSTVPTNDWIGLYPYVECLAAQAIAAIAVIALFAIGFARKRRLRSAATAADASGTATSTTSVQN